MTKQTKVMRAVLYVRISDDREGLEKGVDRQEADERSRSTPSLITRQQTRSTPRPARTRALKRPKPRQY